MTRLTVDFDWERLGDVAVDVAGRIVFPEAPAAPGIDRLWYEPAQERPGVYIGEAANLRTRFQQYPTPSAAQATNVRGNAEMKLALGAGARVTVWVATEVQAQFEPGQWTSLDLARKNQRFVLEQAAIAATLLAEDLSDEEGGAALRVTGAVPIVHPRDAQGSLPSRLARGGDRLP